MKRVTLVAPFAAIACAVIAGCFQTKSEVDVKPIDVNLNITGRMEVVITDARKQEQEITGSAPKRTVRPEDIGLPPAPAAAPAPQSDATGPDAVLAHDGGAEARLMLVAEIITVQAPGDPEAQAIQQMAARHPQIRALLDSQSVGESHTGFLVSKTSLSASQEAAVAAENADRAELYKLESAKKNTPIDQVALSYYMARLEHVNKGTWVERYNKSATSWEWFLWDR
jgi:uncharacterized protein YdbL (DUF1318 family)